MYFYFGKNYEAEVPQITIEKVWSTTMDRWSLQHPQSYLYMEMKRNHGGHPNVILFFK